MFFVCSITIVIQDVSDFSSLVYFIILGCIGGMGILLGVCIVVRCGICYFVQYFSDTYGRCRRVIGETM